MICHSERRLLGFLLCERAYFYQMIVRRDQMWFDYGESDQMIHQLGHDLSDSHEKRRGVLGIVCLCWSRCVKIYLFLQMPWV